MGNTSLRVLLCCSLLIAGAALQPVRAAVTVKAAVVSLPGATLQVVTASMQDADDGAVRVHLQAARASVPAMGWQRLPLQLDGTLRRDDRLRWVFNGNIKLTGAPGSALGRADVDIVISPSANTLQIDLRQGAALAAAFLPLDQPSHAQITLKRLPAGWLQGLLGTLWSGRVSGGQVDAALAFDVRDTGIQSSGEFTMRNVDLDTPGGTVAARQLAAAGRFGLDSTNTPSQFNFDGNLTGGEVLLGPIYASLPAHPVQLELHASSRRGVLEISRLRVNDPDALQLEGAVGFAADGTLARLKLASMHARFPAASERYAQAWLGTLGLPGAKIKGDLDVTLDLRSAGPRAFSFATQGLDLADTAGRLAVRRLRGALDWSATGTRAATKLAWDTFDFYRLPLGAAQSHWRSENGSLALQGPFQVPLLHGQLRFSALEWRPAAARGQRLATSLAVTGVEMAEFSRAMGWPAFPGKLGGAVPSLRWVDDRVEFSGGLSANLFDGFVDITGLSLQHPFGPNPVLAADLTLRQLDLGALTSVFDFGSITGRLDGEINDLRLIDWSPVAFRGHLLAGSGGRISQRAVNNLTSVGGGGVAAGLQGAVLKLFKTFGYRRIGLNCILQGSVCQMSGLEPTEDGYTIVEGSGLPHLHVIGHQNRVDWPTLVQRLRDAIHGAPPQVR